MPNTKLDSAISSLDQAIGDLVDIRSGKVNRAPRRPISGSIELGLIVDTLDDALTAVSSALKELGKRD
jgi:hypothetical protein